MFESLKEAFRQAGENFRTELNRDRVPEALDRLLLALKEELAELTRQSGRLERELERVEAEGAAEAERAETCLRRRRLAEEIGDTETAALASEFAGKHRRRRELLVVNASALSKELAERRAMMAETTALYRAARDRREPLVATVGRARSRERMQRARELFEEMDRIAGKIENLETSSEATRELEQARDPGSVGEAPGGRGGDPIREEEADARLEVLKRKLSEE